MSRLVTSVLVGLGASLAAAGCAAEDGSDDGVGAAVALATDTQTIRLEGTVMGTKPFLHEAHALDDWRQQCDGWFASAWERYPNATVREGSASCGSPVRVSHAGVLFWSDASIELEVKSPAPIRRVEGPKIEAGGRRDPVASLGSWSAICQKVLDRERALRGGTFVAGSCGPARDIGTRPFDHWFVYGSQVVLYVTE